MTLFGSTLVKRKIVKSVTDQYLKYFDLEEGYLLTINNYNSPNYSFIQGTGNYMKTMQFSPQVAAGCGQATMNCITDAYSNHGWASVGLWIETAAIWETAAVVGAACTGKNCKIL